MFAPGYRDSTLHNDGYIGNTAVQTAAAAAAAAAEVVVEGCGWRR